ncbi:hypothetical protein C7974DRAFT_87962 [Boeremia exigua]|uniref:uncharacterized protein n=1 Tax=Boeremia exigua TaxID=749465 RepID=UPI001E8DF257|nr:uncharacterized protein C7974DRAFT_87962 [Boeremia exigua]KAH6611953.1 hypothetical protein C7974DRAFT_87962 [Boeremia exigua]
MVNLSTKSLLALVWACAALATPLITEPVWSHDLTARDDTPCPDTGYTSRNGMNFTTYCNSNNGGNDAMERKWFTSPSMADCMEHCSRYWGNSEGCYGVVWREDNKCWIRNSNTTVSGVKPSTDKTHSALIAANTYARIDPTCPDTDLSTHTIDGVPGLGYTLHCNKVIGGYDTCWSGYPKPCWDLQHVDGVFIGFYHTKTLEECVRICTDQSPLCKGVSWNPDYSIGFANCWPKTGYENAINTPAEKDGILHSVTITSFDSVDDSCPSTETYSTTNNNNFDIHCGQANDGTNLTQVHTQNVTSCMNSCATTDKCVGVVFDTTLQDGFKNCYLKNTTSTTRTTSTTSNKASVMYASLSGSSIPSSSSTSTAGNSTSGSNSNSNSSSSSSSGSKAWIAGPVVGGVVGLAIVAGAAIWWRRRKSNAEVGEKHDGVQYDTVPGYSPGQNPYGAEQQTAYAHPMNEADPGAVRNELPETTKYAHRSGHEGLHEAP